MVLDGMIGDMVLDGMIVNLNVEKNALKTSPKQWKIIFYTEPVCAQLSA